MRFAKRLPSGVGETAYTRGTQKSGLALQLEPSLKAIDYVGPKPTDIDGVVPYFPGGGIAEDFVAISASRSRAVAVRADGRRDLCRGDPERGDGGGDRRLQERPDLASAAPAIPARASRPGRSSSRNSRWPREFEAPIGMFAPAQLYAQGARRHMELYGTTARHFAEVAVTTRQHAILNGNVVMNKPLTVEEHHASRMISDPFRLFDCSLESDGGAAIIISAADRAKDLKKPLVTIMGVAEGHPESPASIAQPPDLLNFGLVKAASAATRWRVLGRRTSTLLRSIDCFTFTVLRQLEILGFCKTGEGGPFVMDGRIGLGRRIADQHAWRSFEPGPCRRPQPRDRADPPAAPRGGQGAGQGCEGRPGHRLRRHGRRLAQAILRRAA